MHVAMLILAVLIGGGIGVFLRIAPVLIRELLDVGEDEDASDL